MANRNTLVNIELTEKDIERFKSKILKTEKCWIWTDVPAKNGYGYIGIGGRKGRKIQAHKIAYELAFGAVPQCLHIDHLCRIRNCVNPNHLEAVTQKENLLRGSGAAAKNHNKTHCLRGHLFCEENTYFGKWGRFCRLCERIRGKERRSKKRGK